jgi:hypothetical protein
MIVSVGVGLTDNVNDLKLSVLRLREVLSNCERFDEVMFDVGEGF